MTTEFTQADFEVVEMTNKVNERLKVRPMYFEQRYSPRPHIFARRVVYDGLLKALNILPPHYGLLVWDAYRPRAVQGRLFEWMQSEIKKKNPDLTNQEIYHEARKYMSPPSNVGDDYCPPHLSGGAVDLTLYDTVSGDALDMGTPFDDCSERAHSRYFDQKNSLTPEEEIFRVRRTLLRHVMQSAGFSAYQYEWWHYDIGNIFWAKALKRQPVFGPLFGDREWEE